MADTNVVVVSGRLASDPVLKKVGEFDNCTFRLASNTNIGKDKERQLFIDVVSWSGLAGLIQKLKKKGDQVIVTGQLRLDQWEKEGQKQSKYFIDAKDISFVGAPSLSEGSSTTPDHKSSVTSTKVAPPSKKTSPTPQAQAEDEPPF